MGAAEGDAPGSGSRDPRAAALRAHAALADLLPRAAARARELVLLGSRPVGELRAEIDRVAGVLDRHAGETAPFLAALRASHRPVPIDTGLLEREHAVFPESVGQLRVFLAVVEQDDHGGNRQALGQYWTALVEALELHDRDEAVGLGLAPPAAVDPNGPPAPR